MKLSEVHTLQELTNYVIDQMDDRSVKSIIDLTTVEQFTSMAHHSLGQHLRNTLKLWEIGSDIYNLFYNIYGLKHADDMSDILLHNIYNTVHEITEIGWIAEQIEHYRKHWERADFVNEYVVPCFLTPTPKVNLLSFEVLRLANTTRLPLFKNSKGEIAHSSSDGSDWSISDWTTAILGELGEFANIIKKVRRGDFTLEQARPEIAKELADVGTYLDILAKQCGVDLGEAITQKFNEVSDRVKVDVHISSDGTEVLMGE